MRLQSITIKNFRSITKASRVPLDRLTVLLGPNNEGKSNVLRALVIAMRTALGQRPRGVRRALGPLPDDVFDWERDYPVHLQDTTPSGVSEFILEFELTKTEEDEFLKEVGSKIKTPLPIEVLLGQNGPPKIHFRKRGPGSSKVTEKRVQISEFLEKRVDFDYIPAVRTADAVDAVLGNLVARELSTLENNQEYVGALQKVKETQQPIFAALSQSITQTLKQFLPAVSKVEIEVSERRPTHPRQVEILVDDGTATELRYKGDGVQSLAALALLRFAASRNRAGKDVVLAIEEPESHLHPQAIHELHAVLTPLAGPQQIVLTTHCQLFVDRQDISTNIIVQRGTARPAKSVEEIRAVLGVLPADNLRHAELVLVVEGEDDRIAIGAILASRSQVVKAALSSNRLAIDTLGGASNLVYKLGLLRSALCAFLCFLDGDKEGRIAAQKAKEARITDESKISYASLVHLEETEWEDLLSDSLVEKTLREGYGVTTTAVPKAYQRRKWSDRLRFVFQAVGKQWDDAVESDLKLRLAQAAAAAPDTALRPTTAAPVDNLVKVLEASLQ